MLAIILIVNNVDMKRYLCGGCGAILEIPHEKMRKLPRYKKRLRKCVFCKKKFKSFKMTRSYCSSSCYQKMYRIFKEYTAYLVHYRSCGWCKAHARRRVNSITSKLIDPR